ncbi:pyridoxamine 5'-phosphate oxidase family protein [Staphylococcus carnosus]|uniref:pyridoxamine 5'-phosphate oxidase family protein n=1 Tax=Staphylococcus carnosus TaxID=1281 RepID=UPI00081A96A5|nr:pyridoxamine 5'-phosphate oxidase family protein [Staphylococcus carnosus]ANZ34546.1 pyridoxamine 5-phosphate oxidase [Staphylococcus carnosus]UTB84409.1 pyridoxamine 5-phosphate oxidase [Staphylococcus carnosus]
MDREVVLKKIKEIMKESRIGVLSTSQDNVPDSRYMIFYDQEFDLYTKTSRDSLKIEEIEKNPIAHILLGYDDTKNHSFLEIYANLEVTEDPDVIDWIWEEQDKSFFRSKSDPKLCVIRAIPTSIKLMNSDSEDGPQLVEFD